jgi:IPT/TIG domain
VPNYLGNTLVEFTPGQLATGGSVTRADTIDGNDTGLNQPEGLVIEHAPTVSSISTDHGPNGTQVTISGTGFYLGSTVNFGGARVASVTYVTPYEMTAVAPAGTGAVDVTVTTGQGTSECPDPDACGPRRGIPTPAV